MGEPLTRSDPAAATGEGPIADSARRLERALASLEASLKRTVAAAGVGGAAASGAALLAELDAVRGREQALEGAAAAASEVLGHAMAEVRRVLAADAAASFQGELELDFALETEAPLADDEGDAADEAPEEDPA